MNDALTLAAYSAITEAVNTAAAEMVGHRLPGVMWMWNCYGVGTEDGVTPEFIGMVDAEAGSRAEAALLVWADAVGMAEATTAKERREGRTAYTGVLTGSRIRLTANITRAAGDPGALIAIA
ncbi:hypothetical protein [Nocardia sp. NPDC052566]|uniref:hypothetical protein n=1 Tax=Nocardia sp. NPDC052566 TaxID=3364330 RepID=UPI0037CAD2E7